MRSIRRSGVTALTAAIALALGAVPVALTAGMFPGVDEDTSVIQPAVAFDTATLRLAMEPSGGPDTVTQFEGNVPGRVQDLVDPKSGCTLQTTGPSLLSLSATRRGNAANVGFDVDAIGVAEKDGGESCAQVGSVGTEKLTLRPGIDLGASFSSASLDMELKQGAAITGLAKLNGQTVWTFSLTSGSSASGPLTPVVDMVNRTTKQACKVVSDSGPDAKAGDNCQWRMGTSGEGVTFDSLELAATAGSFSLEGGADYTTLGTQADHRSVFTLDFSIDCLSSRALAGSTDGTVPAVTVTRLDNADGTTCEKIIYRFTNGTQFAQFLKSPTDEPAAQFVFDFEWTSPAETGWTAAGADPNPLLPRTTADFEADGDPLLEEPVTIAWCPDLVPYVDADGSPITVNGQTFRVVDGIKDNGLAIDQADDFPGTGADDTKQFACIISQNSEVSLDDPTKVTVHEQIYVYGDIILKKAF